MSDIDKIVRITARPAAGSGLPDPKPFNDKNSRGIILSPLIIALPKSGGTAVLG